MTVLQRYAENRAHFFLDRLYKTVGNPIPVFQFRPVHRGNSYNTETVRRFQERIPLRFRTSENGDIRGIYPAGRAIHRVAFGSLRNAKTDSVRVKLVQRHEKVAAAENIFLLSSGSIQNPAARRLTVGKIQNCRMIPLFQKPFPSKQGVAVLHLDNDGSRLLRQNDGINGTVHLRSVHHTGRIRQCDELAVSRCIGPIFYNLCRFQKNIQAQFVQDRHIPLIICGNEFCQKILFFHDTIFLFLCGNL